MSQKIDIIKMLRGYEIERYIKFYKIIYFSRKSGRDLAKTLKIQPSTVYRYRKIQKHTRISKKYLYEKG